MSLPLSPPEEKILRALWAKGPVAGARFGPDPLPLQRLVDNGLIVALPASSSRSRPRYVLSERGRAIAAELPPSNLTSADLYRVMLSLRDELRALNQRLAAPIPSPCPRCWGKGADSIQAHAEADSTVGRSPAAPSPRGEPIPLPPHREGQGGGPTPVDHDAERRRLEFQVEVRRALDQAERQGRLGGLVPLPVLRAHLAHLGHSRAELDAALLDAERAYAIDLKVANDPSALPDPVQGIAVEGRGLLYYVVAR